MRARIALVAIVSLASIVPSGAKPLDARAVLAAERLATGGRAWDRIGAAVVTGTITEGGAPGTFEKTIDWRNGHSRTTQVTGIARQLSGYDGVEWGSNNGIVNARDLPALIEDARSKAFVERGGWREAAFAGNAGLRAVAAEDGQSVTIAFRPAGGSDVALTFDATTHLVTRITVDTDDGPLVTTLSDWRSIGPVRYPFRQDTIDSTGSETLLEVQSVRLQRRADPAAFARPRPVAHGHLLAGTSSTTPITLTGSRQSHILVPATIAGTETHLIFDTGAANYYSPEAARRFGLAVSGGLNLTGVGESSTNGGFAVADRIAIGNAELRDETVIVAPLPFPSTPTPQGPGAEGFAGFEFLYEFRTTIDYPARTITFASRDQPQPAGGVKVPFYSDGHALYVEAEVEGHRGIFRLDTGDGSTVTIFPKFAALHALDRGEGPAPAPSGGGIGGQVKARDVTFSRFTLAGLHFDNLPGRLSLNKAGAFTSRTLAGNLGAGVLRCFRITFDYQGRTLTFEPGPPAPGCNGVH